jgi:hypothetical protein
MCSQTTTDENKGDTPAKSLVVPDEDEGNGGAILGVLFLLLLGGVAFKMKDKILKALGRTKGGVGSMMSNNSKAAAKYHEM